MDADVPTILKAARREDTAASSPADVREAVATIIADVRARGDVAVRECSERFDRWSPERFRLEPDEIERIVAGVPAQVRDDIRTAQAPATPAGCGSASTSRP